MFRTKNLTLAQQAPLGRAQRSAPWKDQLVELRVHPTVGVLEEVHSESRRPHSPRFFWLPVEPQSSGWSVSDLRRFASKSLCKISYISRIEVLVSLFG